MEGGVARAPTKQRASRVGRRASGVGRRASGMERRKCELRRATAQPRLLRFRDARETRTRGAGRGVCLALEGGPQPLLSDVDGRRQQRHGGRSRGEGWTRLKTQTETKDARPQAGNGQREAQPTTTKWGPDWDGPKIV
ncbi:hypothetical protein E2C01_017187 [Portunus trituberculatus]|uniref:Uncharacterized protein n=1 Tax=Portunus trituberculatus TaxID=210409 RepID=A0A5B7DS82_PORTR|nr:hypothetical protein [Portunus trituberculatus]